MRAGGAHDLVYAIDAMIAEIRNVAAGVTEKTRYFVRKRMRLKGARGEGPR